MGATGESICFLHAWVHRVTWRRQRLFVCGFSLQIPLSGVAGRPERLPVHLFAAP
jgi:hypothetical protein